MRKWWNKFYVCNCDTEGIMISYEYEENGLPLVDLGFFQQGLKCDKQSLSFKDKLRWCWHILTKGVPFADLVILDQETAKELGEDLIKFSQKEYKK